MIFPRNGFLLLLCGVLLLLMIALFYSDLPRRVLDAAGNGGIQCAHGLYGAALHPIINYNEIHKSSPAVCLFYLRISSLENAGGIAKRTRLRPIPVRKDREDRPGDKRI